MTHEDKLTFHAAWGVAKSRDDYHKPDWIRLEGIVARGREDTFADWLDSARCARGALHVSEIGANRAGTTRNKQATPELALTQAIRAARVAAEQCGPEVAQALTHLDNAQHAMCVLRSGVPMPTVADELNLTTCEDLEELARECRRLSESTGVRISAQTDAVNLARDLAGVLRACLVADDSHQLRSAKHADELRDAGAQARVESSRVDRLRSGIARVIGVDPAQLPLSTYQVLAKLNEAARRWRSRCPVIASDVGPEHTGARVLAFALANGWAPTCEVEEGGDDGPYYEPYAHDNSTDDVYLCTEATIAQGVAMFCELHAAATNLAPLDVLAAIGAMP